MNAVNCTGSEGIVCFRNVPCHSNLSVFCRVEIEINFVPNFSNNNVDGFGVVEFDLYRPIEPG